MPVSAGAGAGTRSWSWLHGLLCGALAVSAPWTVGALILLLLPGLIALSLERDRARPVGRAMLLFGAAAAIGPVRAGIAGGAGSVLGLCSPSDVAVAWAASGAAWLLTQGAGPLTFWIARQLDRGDVSRLSAERTALIARWRDGAPSRGHEKPLPRDTTRVVP
jgi:hypothetical protein